MERYAIIDNDYVLFENGVVLSLKTNKFIEGSVNSKGYIRIKLHDMYKSLHRLLAESFIDNTDNKHYVDHIDQDKLNNDLANLRWATHSENQQNKGMQSNNTTGKCCIVKSRLRRNWYWRVQVHKDSKSHRKRFPCKESDTVVPDYVIKYRDDLKRELHGEFASV
jgi:hypothetical protein